MASVKSPDNNELLGFLKFCFEKLAKNEVIKVLRDTILPRLMDMHVNQVPEEMLSLSRMKRVKHQIVEILQSEKDSRARRKQNPLYHIINFDRNVNTLCDAEKIHERLVKTGTDKDPFDDRKSLQSYVDELPEELQPKATAALSLIDTCLKLQNRRFLNVRMNSTQEMLLEKLQQSINNDPSFVAIHINSIVTRQSQNPYTTKQWNCLKAAIDVLCSHTNKKANIEFKQQLNEKALAQYQYGSDEKLLTVDDQSAMMKATAVTTDDNELTEFQKTAIREFIKRDIGNYLRENYHAPNNIDNLKFPESNEASDATKNMFKNATGVDLNKILIDPTCLHADLNPLQYSAAITYFKQQVNKVIAEVKDELSNYQSSEASTADTRQASKLQHSSSIQLQTYRHIRGAIQTGPKLSVSSDRTGRHLSSPMIHEAWDSADIDTMKAASIADVDTYTADASAKFLALFHSCRLWVIELFVEI